MRTPGLASGSRPPNETRSSFHSLHTIPDSNASRAHDDDNDDKDDTLSIHSSRSDQSLEAAGLVSRLSDEEERANRHAKYEGGKRLGSATATNARTFRYSDEEDAGNENDGTRDSIHGIAADGVFRDRSSSDRRRATRKKAGMLLQAWHISREALPTLAISLLSLVFSGELLVHLARWPVFSKVDKLFILIPILLNLKGNLEGNLSLRMSTSANIGELDIRRTRETLIIGNLALLQVQALIVSLFAGILAFLLGIGGPGENAPALRRQHQLSARRVIHHHPKLDPSLKLRNTYFEFVLVIATGMLSASMSSAILGSFMCALVVITRQLGGNPDNIASPLAGSLGDLLTLSLLGLIGSFLVRFEGTILATLILFGLVLACLIFFVVSYRNAYVRELLSSGWIPLVIAMFISSGAGLVLDAFVQKFEGFALLTPVVTGIPGACSAIFVSRISTALHSGKGNRDRTIMSNSNQNNAHHSRIRKFFTGMGPTEGWLVPITLFTIGLSIMVSFVIFIHLSGQMSFAWPFYVSFTILSAVIVLCSLALSHFITISLWQRDYDPGEKRKRKERAVSPLVWVATPILLRYRLTLFFHLDIYCLPFVSSIVDVFGQGLLVLVYYLAIFLGDNITAAVNDQGK
jgi:solute carrier family 41